jgi:hypothetical protein
LRPPTSIRPVSAGRRSAADPTNSSHPRDRAERPLSYLAGDAAAVRQALDDPASDAARLDDRRLTNTLLHVSICLLVKVGTADTETPRLRARITGLCRTVRRSMHMLIERLKAYG